ncbi:MAG: TAT-variant-translocated molybdopterin oxidoreductase, partial [Cyclobacteriaceae bacterium]
MKENKKTYWKGLEQLTNDPEFVKHADQEFPGIKGSKNQGEDGGSSRRDFLKMMGFSLAAASLAACEAPVRKAIPY